MSIESLRKRLEPQLLALEDVTGVSQVEDRLRIYVEGTPDIWSTHIEGYKVEVVKTGKLKALSQLMGVPWFVPKAAIDSGRTGRVRPAPGGVSIGHPSVTAGTLGAVITLGGVKYGLSNNHVFAAGSTIQMNRALIGDPILQPGVYDGGVEEDSIGTLSWYYPLDEVGKNLVDMALMKPASPELVSDEILGIGVPTGYAKAELEDMVQKSGRTTGVTGARVLDVDATVKVSYGTFEATFVHQIITDYMADGGDSGSVLVKGTDICGLLYAGSSYVTVHNHISDVLATIGAAPRVVAGSPLLPILLPTLAGIFSILV